MFLVRRLAPALFVVLWSTGFIVARYATNDAGALSFLAVRTAAAFVVLWLAARAAREQPLDAGQVRLQWLVGIPLHGMYLGGVFVAVGHGLPSGISALIAALHPVFTAVAGRVVLDERLGRRQMAGTLLGFGGVVAVVAERGGAGDGVSAFALWAMAVAVVGMSLGTLVQRRSGQSVPLLGGAAWQYASATVVLGIGALVSEGWRIEWTANTILSLAWAIGVLSVAAIVIMLWLLRRHAASAVSSLFFLTPALSTVEGAILFGERLGVLSIAGLGVAVTGVWLATST